ncbi:carbonic anhydrase [Phakopsora pachyrhizi]|uniref:Carbonic anhydrase n=1 Tax=Phakopsora pachyrhizi TaxID=170000 RepID=A0AAV0BQH9_PHAPC|nr:carbonic anhydrase [Phakopsora pachyrhizi]
MLNLFCYFVFLNHFFFHAAKPLPYFEKIYQSSDEGEEPIFRNLQTGKAPNTRAHKLTRIDEFLNRNEVFAARTNPSIFKANSVSQFPSAYVIGCSDSRVPISRILGAGIGEVFETRNIANQYEADSPASVSALGYAVKTLKVPHVVVIGHEGCGGCTYSLEEAMLEVEGSPKLADNTQSSKAIYQYTSPLKDLARSSLLLNNITSPNAPSLKKTWQFIGGTRKPNEFLVSSLVELNVIKQVEKIAKTQIVQSTWQEGKKLTVHGWIYNIKDGHLHPVITRSGRVVLGETSGDAATSGRVQAQLNCRNFFYFYKKCDTVDISRPAHS